MHFSPISPRRTLRAAKEIRKGAIRLEETVVPAAEIAGCTCQKILINEQTFTKTANIRGVTNNARGTNTNRIVLLRK